MEFIAPTPPAYSSFNPPDYSFNPLPGEQCIQKTPLQAWLRHSSSPFSFKENRITLTLRNCRKERDLPTYGLGSSVLGEVAVEDRDKISSVSVNLQGQILIEGPSQKVVMFSQRHRLWTRDPLQNELCPGKKITREAQLIAQLRYHPRVRPPRPVPSQYIVKDCPEDWHEEMWTVKGSMVAPPEPLVTKCHFHFPSVRVFTISDIIPFHLRLQASSSAVETIMRTYPPTHGATHTNLPVYVYLLRQIVVESQGTRTSGEMILGTGKMILQSTIPVEDTSSGEQSLSWDGTLRCFTTREVTVKDFMVVSLFAPPKTTKDSSSHLRHAIPVRLVTEPWIDRT
ncbi:hypothetical protein BJ138DRAFT_1102375 [Hygrophoropsis aurantiaca]|uniref:Uncharacterized protein n=1 Tax=Hygrophoropsis aurantiaca TaxID=72124 RepID=A0ACB8A985_9AGAM|nr:hypothetical protein BJ138DRAFT_1102375 [Hygrophoropsis aurantiaca]